MCDDPKDSKKKKNKRSSNWIIALQVYHAIQRDGDSIREELREIGGDILIADGGPVCDSSQEFGNSWVIPARGTPEYKEVREIMRCLDDPVIARDARSFIELQSINSEATKTLRETRKVA